MTQKARGAKAARRGENGAGAAAERDLDLRLFRQMVLIRKFEEAVQSLFLRNEIYGTTHLYSGQEAGAVGVVSQLRQGDRVAATYRGHGAALALGTSPQALMDELCGRATGVCAGRAGSMNVVDLEHGLLGCFGIVGASCAAALGAALAFRHRDMPNVAVAFHGDGATNQAYFFECLNFAKVERLPLLFFCENNLYMEYTRTSRVTAGDIAERPKPFGIPAESIDGNDLWAVREAVGRAIERIRSGGGPAFVESRTYRLVGHSRSDPARYRPPGELEEWEGREPLVVARRELAARHGVEATEIEALEAAVQAEVDAVVESAVAAPWPDAGEPVPEFAP
ncbi:MAG: thiamine pyrophosphate-dependent dehydrogenase E1 component subunit alpha [Actinobacteria bacterium]|nr:thiamine pyrophosphate-dependent dehydrogenase E1 component subunit alpha [Actinomycetota bacterium]